MTVTKTEKISATATNIIDLSQKIVHTPHIFIGIKFLDGSGNVVTPSAGTFSITVKPAGMNDFSSLTGGDAIDATAALPRLSAGDNISALKYTPTGITGAVTVEIFVTGNLS